MYQVIKILSNPNNTFISNLKSKYCLRPSHVINQENCYPLDAELSSHSNIDSAKESTAEIQQSSKTETDSGKVLSIYH